MANTQFDIPPEANLQCRRGSPSLQSFYEQFFENDLAWRGEFDLSFLDDLTPQETELAKDLIRRNLKLKYNHIIEGAAALNDRDAVPELKEMLACESNLSRRLPIAGSLWKLDKDPAFIECLRDMAESGDETLKSAHIFQIPWLGDKRAVDLLIDLLGDDSSFVQQTALRILNELEHKRSFGACVRGDEIVMPDLPHAADCYLLSRSDDDFVKKLVENLAEWPWEAETVKVEAKPWWKFW